MTVSHTRKDSESRAGFDFFFFCEVNKDPTDA